MKASANLFNSAKAYLLAGMELLGREWQKTEAKPSTEFKLLNVRRDYIGDLLYEELSLDSEKTEANPPVETKKLDRAGIETLPHRPYRPARFSSVIQSGPLSFDGLREWVRGDNGFMLREVKESLWRERIIQNGERLHSLREYRGFLNELLKDAELAPLLNSTVGTAAGARFVALHEIPDLFLCTLAERWESTFSEDEFAEGFESIDAELRRTELEFTALTPLFGLKLDCPALVLGPDFEIDQFTDLEIGQCLDANLYPSPPVLWGRALINESVGLRVRYRFPRRINRKLARSDLHKLNEQENFVHVMPGEIVHALRVFKQGRIAVGGTVCVCDQWPMRRYSSWRPAAGADAYGSTEYTMTADDATAFVAFWSAFTRSKNNKCIDRASRRFGYAGDRRLAEDRIADLMIAAESLVLNDERGEGAYRLAERFAFFLEGTSEYTRQELFDLMRSAYHIRNNVVHGGTPEKKQLKSPKEGQVSLERFIEIAEDLLRLAIKKAISSGLPDWVKLVFG